MGNGAGLNQEAVRRTNLSRILGHVHRAGQISRSSLTACTGLNRSTVGTLVGELAARGLVEEVSPVGRGTPGRPSPLVQVTETGFVALACDVEVDSLAVAVAGLGGRLIVRRERPRLRGRLSPEQTVADLVDLANEVLASDEVAGRRVVGVGIAVVGLVRRDDGVVQLAPNLGWRDVPLAAMVDEGLGLGVPVAVGNEADLGALAEHTRGAGAGVDNMLFLSGEVGVGAGIIVGGRPLMGADGYAGEVGHMTVNPRGRPCACGSTGCWETEIAERALLREARRADTGGQEAVDALLREAAAGSPTALAALERVGSWLGIGLASLVNLFNPSRIVLGGLFARTYPYLATAVREELDRRALVPARRVVDIVSARLGDDSELIGAVELAFGPVLEDPSTIPLAQDGARLLREGGQSPAAAGDPARA